MAIPNEIPDSERIVRIIYSPMNIKEKTNRIKSNFFVSPKNKDEVSVLRLDYTTPDFCKELGKKNQSPDKMRSYYGLARIDASEIRSVRADVIASGIKHVEVHADIVIGEIVTEDMPISKEGAFKQKQMAKMARSYPDPDIDNTRWTGLELI